MIWNRNTLGEIYKMEGGSVQTGPFGSQLHESDYTEFGIPVIMPKDILDDQLDLTNIAHISIDDAERLSQHIVQKNDIVCPRRGEIGKRIIINNETAGALCGTGCIRLRGTGSILNPLFLFYFLKQPRVVKWIENQAIGATMMNLNTSILNSIPITYPSLSVQNKIVSLLLAYDILIENNKKRIKLLEEMAEEIYKEWFVRLRFPGYETARYFNHAGKEVSKDTHGAIPEGWSYSTLSDHLKIFRGKSYSSEELRDNEGRPMLNLKNINRGGGFRRDGLKYFEGKFAKHHLTYSGDIILAITDMTQNRELVGRVAIIPEMGIQEFIISMDLIKIVPIHLPKIFLYSFFRYSGIGLKLAEFANGANVLHLTPDLIYLEKAKLPNLELAMKFEEFSKPIINEIDVLENKNQLLQQTRDLLLPRLISGKLSVEHLMEPTPEGVTG